MMTDRIRQTAERYLLPIHFDSESSDAIIRKLEIAGKRLVTLPGGWAAAVDTAADKAPYEFTAVTLRLRAGNRLDSREADELLDRLFSSLTASLDGTFWPALKSVLLSDRKDVFFDHFAPRLRAFSDGDFRQQLTEPYGSHIGSDSTDEGRLINLRACIAMAEVLDRPSLNKFILYSRINFKLASPEEKSLFHRLCDVFFERRAFTALRNLFFKIDAFDLLTTIFPMTADTFLDSALEGLPEDEKSACLSFVRDLLEARHETRAAANEAWYALIKARPDEFSPWYSFVYHVYHITESETKEEREAAIDAMPSFTAVNETFSWYYTDILLQKLHTCIFETAPANYRYALSKTAVYNRYGDETRAVTHPKKLGLDAGKLAELTALKEPAAFVAPSFHYLVRDLVQHFHDAGLEIKDVVDVYRGTFLHSVCPLRDLLAATASVYGDAALSQARLGRLFYGYTFYGVLSVPESGWTGNRYLGYVRGLNVALGTNTLLLTSTVKPHLRESIKAGDVIRLNLSGYDARRELLIFQDVEPVNNKALDTTAEQKPETPLRAVLAGILQRGRITDDDLMALATAGADSGKFDEQVELNYLFAEACGAAGNDSRLLDDFMYLFQRANRDRHAYRILKFMPRFHRPVKEKTAGKTDAELHEEALKPDRIRAASLFEALCQKITNRRNLFKIYMQTILRDLLFLDDVIIKLYGLGTGESADLTDLRDGEQYWLRGAIHAPYRNQPFVYPLQVPVSSLTLMTTRTSPLMEELLAVPSDTRLYCRISGYFNGFKARRLLIDEAASVEDISAYMPNEHFMAALRRLISSTDAILGNPPEEVVLKWLRSNQVRLEGNDYEQYVYLLFNMVCQHRASLAELEDLQRKMGPNHLFDSRLLRGVHTLRYMGLPTHRAMAAGALKRFLQEEPVGLVTQTYFNSFLRAIVDLGTFCRLILEEHPDLSGRPLIDLMAPYRLIVERVPDDKRTFRLRNVLCEDLEFKDPAHTGPYQFDGLTSEGVVKLTSVI